jgi:hypothetical protein
VNNQTEQAPRTYEFLTSCAECIFAERNLLEQTGCKFDRLSKYEKQGIEIQSDEAGNKIIGTFCNTCRTEEAANKYTDTLTEVRKEVAIKVAVLVNVESLTDYDEAILNLTDTVLSCFNARLRPTEIQILVRNPEMQKNIVKTQHYLQELFEKHNIKGMIFQLHNVLNSKKNRRQALSECMKRSESTYYYTVVSGDKIEPDIFAKADYAINDEMVRFTMVEATNGKYGSLIQTKVHKGFGGTQEIDIVDKIRMAAKEQELPHMIKTWEEIDELTKSYYSNS